MSVALKLQKINRRKLNARQKKTITFIRSQAFLRTTDSLQFGLAMTGTGRTSWLNMWTDKHFCAFSKKADLGSGRNTGGKIS
ncbi:MAG TPA: hypothetical protein VE263_12815 [Candidatus Angelobacter sp.]|nr:hypothetical protein [Candidatus Angelobacter sp.]